MRIFGREPALILALVAAVVQAVSAFGFTLTPDQQGVINALAVAVVGVVTGVIVKGDSLLPSLTGGFQALLALLLAFGLDFTSEQQSTVMLLVTTVLAIVVRDRVIAPVPMTVEAGHAA